MILQPSVHCVLFLLVITAVIVSVWFVEMTSGFHLSDRSLLLFCCVSFKSLFVYYSSSHLSFPAFIPKKLFIEGRKISAAFITSEKSAALHVFNVKYE